MLHYLKWKYCKINIVKSLMSGFHMIVTIARIFQESILAIHASDSFHIIVEIAPGPTALRENLDFILAPLHG